jgi:hypothetical protein
MTFQLDINVGWVERSETHHCTQPQGDGFRVALPILRSQRAMKVQL